jgi:hypothetical protein
MDYRLNDIANIATYKSYDFTMSKTIPLRNVVLQNNFTKSLNTTLAIFPDTACICDVEMMHSYWEPIINNLTYSSSIPVAKISLL